MICEKWRQASLENKEIITLGDFNFNSLSWELDKSEMSNYEKSQLKLYDILKEKSKVNWDAPFEQ